MKISFRVVSALSAVLISLLMLTGCSEKEKTFNAHYEIIIDTLKQSVGKCDTQSYLKCFSRAAREEYKASNNYDPDLCEKLTVKDGDKQLALICAITEHRELSADEIEALKKEYNWKYAKRLDIAKAYELDTEFSSGEKIKERKMIVYNDGHEWKIYGSVIENFF